MNHAVLRAVPTGYRGITFRSKCEAVFARNLDLARAHIPNGMLWEYEPERFRQEDGWVFDFLLYLGWRDASKYRSVLRIFLEYKPAEPTAEYLHQLAVRFRNYEDDGSTGYFLAVANPYDTLVPRKVMESMGGDEFEELSNWSKTLFKHLESARDYRFDLA